MPPQPTRGTLRLRKHHSSDVSHAGRGERSNLFCRLRDAARGIRQTVLIRQLRVAPPAITADSTVPPSPHPPPDPRPPTGEKSGWVIVCRLPL